MLGFGRYLSSHRTSSGTESISSVESLRLVAASHSAEFMQYRSTIAASFLAEMRRYARTIDPQALVTCNNSLNSPNVFFSQCRTYGYNIRELSKVEDLVVVEDMVSQPRALSDGAFVEYGPVYEMLHAISSGKPIIAVTLADGDYGTPANLVRLAMAEAAAHDASYLSWPTWPELVRSSMIAQIRPQSALLRQNADLLNGTTQAAEALLFLPYRRWTETSECQPLKVARELSRTNIQFEVVTEENIERRLRTRRPPVVLVESPSVLNQTELSAVEAFQRSGGRVVWTDKQDWMKDLPKAIRDPALQIIGPPSVRAVLRMQHGRWLIHLMNLNIRRVSSVADEVTPASDLRLTIKAPFRVRSVQALSADEGSTQGTVPFASARSKGQSRLEVTVPKLAISTILVIE
jgi:hypothetical protein